MHYPKLVLRLLLFLILISLSFCRGKKTGFIISMEGADTYECFLDHKPEPFCSIQKKDIPYGAQITYYPKEIKIKENETYYESKYEGETIFIHANAIGNEPKKYYFKVFPLDGVSLRSKDDREIQKIAYGEEVEFIRIEDNKYYFRFKDKEGILNTYDLVELKEHIYFKVSTSLGLNLREAPDMKSKILVTTPYQTVGEIIEADKTIYTIQDRKGYWVKTSFENKVGWLFSGFVFLSNKKENLPDLQNDLEKDFFNFFREVYLISPEFSSRFLINQKQNLNASENKNKFEFVSEIEKGSPDCMDFTKLFYVNKFTGFFHRLGNADENILLRDFGKVFLVKNHGCLQCCCYYGQETIYFIVKDRIASHFLSDMNDKEDSKCGTKAQNIKISKDSVNTFLYIKYGDCGKDTFGYMQREELEKNFKSFTHDMFIKIKINEDDLDIKRVIDKGIPAEYKQEWEEAEEIWKKRE